ncbi:type 2 DNA topoisomerase 6 subunit B-like [Rhynchonycteris naso]
MFIPPVQHFHSRYLVGFLATGFVRDTRGIKERILKYIIIHWKCETAKGALLEGQLVISIEALNSEHQANTLHCVTTIDSAGSIYGGLVCKKFLKEVQSILPGFPVKLYWTSEGASCSQNIAGVTPFQMIFEVDKKPRTLMTDILVIKNFLRKIVMVHPKIRFNFSVKVNGILSTEVFEAENEPTLNLSNGIALVINCQHYMSRPELGTTQSLCSRMHPVLGHPVMLCIPNDVTGKDLLGELILTPAAAVCPCPMISSNHLNRISSLYIFLYGPSGLPLILPQSITTVFKDTSYFIDWKKYHFCMVPNLDINLDRDMVLPDVSYQVDSSEGDQSQNMDPQGQMLMLVLFVDFYSGFPVQQMELWGVHSLLTAHLSTILRESHSVVQDSIQVAVDQALEQHHQAATAHQKLQTSLSVAVNSIMSIVTGSTNRSFRKSCLQALQAADTQEFGTKLHKSFHEITQHRVLHHCSCEVKQQLLPEKHDAEESTEDARENSHLELLAGISGQVENKRLKKGSSRQVVEGMRAFHSARAPSPSEAALRHGEPLAAFPAPSGSRADPSSSQEVTEGCAGKGKDLAAAKASSPRPPFPSVGGAVAAGGLQSVRVAESRPLSQALSARPRQSG